MSKDEQYMQRALDEARAALKEGEIPIGCVIVCKDRIIARAHNLTETLCDVTAHAEMQQSYALSPCRHQRYAAAVRMPS